MPSLLPPRPFLDSLVVRTVVVWFVLKAMAAGGAAALELSPVEAVTSMVGTGWIVLAVLLAVRVDMARRSETVFLANLGWSYRRIAVGAAVLVVLLDGAMAVLALLGDAAGGALAVPGDGGPLAVPGPTGAAPMAVPGPTPLP